MRRIEVKRNYLPALLAVWAVMGFLLSSCGQDNSDRANRIKIQKSGERKTAQKRNQLIRLQNKQDNQIASTDLNSENRNQILTLHSSAVKRNLLSVGISNFTVDGVVNVQMDILFQGEGGQRDEITNLSCRLIENSNTDGPVRRLERTSNCDSKLKIDLVCLDDLCNESMFTLGAVGMTQNPNSRVSGTHQTRYFEPDQSMLTGLSDGKSLALDLNQHIQLVNTEILIRDRERQVFQNIAVSNDQNESYTVLHLNAAKPGSVERPIALPNSLNEDGNQGAFGILGGDRITLNFFDKSETCEEAVEGCNSVFVGDFVSGSESSSRVGNTELSRALEILSN